MLLNDLTGIKYVGIRITYGKGAGRQVYKLTRKGQVLGYVARTLGTLVAPIRAGWSYCVEDAPEDPGNWVCVGPGSTREQAADHLLSACRPSASWLV